MVHHLKHMILIPTLSHMPYVSGATLLFCHSTGDASFEAQTTGFEAANGIAARVTHFQPWQLATKIGNVITPVIHNLVVDSPMRVFCNPVLNGEEVSFMFSRQLYTGRLVDNTLLDLSVAYQGLFTGFKIGSRMAIGKAPCTAGSQLILIDGSDRVALNTTLDSVLRVVPHGSGVIVTGRRGAGFVSVLFQAGNAFRITANGQDVYKCVLSNDDTTVIHAVRAGGFEERYLHSDNAILVLMPDFLQTN